MAAGFENRVRDTENGVVQVGKEVMGRDNMLYSTINNPSQAKLLCPGAEQGDGDEGPSRCGAVYGHH